MKKEYFELGNQEYITLVNLLKYMSEVSSGGEVKHLLSEDLILYNGEIEYRKKKKLFKNDVVEIKNSKQIIIK